MDALGAYLIVNGLENEERRVMRRERIYRTRVAGLEYDERTFMSFFRLTREMVQDLINQLEPAMPPKRRRSDLSAEVRVLAALSFFATGSYQKAVAQAESINISQKSVSRAICQVTNAINERLLPNKIVFPTTPLQQAAVKARFLEKYNFPGVIGCIDGTHVLIVPPPRDHPIYPEHNYVNRYGSHSLNVQLVCDADMKILNFISNFAGRNHDAFIWRQSNLRGRLITQFENQQLRSSWLLGDSGYLLEPWMMLPIPNTIPGSAEERYNKAHIRTRNIIERTIGAIKSRWRCLRKDRVLHYSPPMASKIIASILVLHNIATEHRLPLVENEDINAVPPVALHDNQEANGGEGGFYQAGQRSRTLLLRHFTR